MRTVQATETAVSIWISREEAPTGEKMLALIRQALAEQGLGPWEETEAECFAAGEDTLVIARPGRPRRAAYYFDDLEALLGGALRCPEGDSALYAAGDGYVLALSRQAESPVLAEYGRACPICCDWEVHAREQGMCLLGEGAVAALQRYFGPTGRL